MASVSTRMRREHEMNSLLPAAESPIVRSPRFSVFPNGRLSATQPKGWTPNDLTGAFRNGSNLGTHPGPLALFCGLAIRIAASGAALALPATSLHAAEPLPVSAKIQNHKVVVTVGGKLFTCYKFAPSLKKPYLWPVIGPKSGKSVTVESVPNQFPHHNSIWLGCDRVNNQNFWQPHGRIENGQIRSLGPKLLQPEGQAVVLTDECVWQKPGAAPVIRDVRRITISAPKADLRLIDLDITLQMLTDVTIRKTNHSLFSVRVMPELSVTSGGTLVNAEGRQGEKHTFGVASPWCDYYGTRNGITEGVAFLQYPGNPWYPCKWFTRDYGFMSPTPMYWPPDGRQHRFAKNQRLHLRYRIVVHAGDTKAADIAGLFEQYAKGANAEALEENLAKLKTYEFGQSRKPLIRMTRLIRQTPSTSPFRRTIEERLTAVLATDATFACKQFVCHRLSEIGTGRSVPCLARLLTDEKLSNPARFALERIPSPKADGALRGALGRVVGELRIGVINSLGKRRDRKAVRELAKLARAADKATRAAAISALGRIGGAEAVRELSHMSVRDDLKTVKADALLLCANQMCDQGKISDAARICRRMLTKDHSAQTRVAALEGVVRAEKERALPTVLAFLKEKDSMLQEAAAKLSARVPGTAATKALASQLPSLPSNVQVALLAGLSARGDKAAAPAVAGATREGNETVRAAALHALGVLGNASHVELLARAAAASGVAAKAASEALLLLHGDGVGAAMRNAGSRAPSVGHAYRHIGGSGAS